jgi:2-haloacid dehalogenase
MAAHPTALFDLNGTITDPAAMGRPWNDGALGDCILTRALQTAMAETIIGGHHEFSSHIERALRIEIEVRGLDPAPISDALELAEHLPAFPEVPSSLRRLAGAGWRLAILTNSGAEAARRTLDRAGLTDCFERILGVDAVKAFKPHPDTYSYAAKEIAGDVTFVASHDWDIGGAARAGLRTALVTRGRPRSQIFAEPSLIATDLAGLADHLCR